LHLEILRKRKKTTRVALVLSIVFEASAVEKKSIFLSCGGFEERRGLET
jgi:hypothetical protein